MPEYRVTWVIDGIDAPHRVAAARKARIIGLNPRSTASVYDVAEPGEPMVAIDLDEEGSGRWGNGIDMPDLSEIVARELTVKELSHLIQQLSAELMIKIRKEDIV